jgi:1-acyl-sn-glycerol-3-phosphate acyltransferase
MRVPTGVGPSLPYTSGAAWLIYDPPMAASVDPQSAPSIAEPVVRPTDGALGTCVAAVRSLAAYVAIAAYIGLVAPPGLLIVRIFRWTALLYALGHAGIRLGLALCGIRWQLAGRDHLSHPRAVVFCANHQSNIDPPVLFQALHPRLHVLYKAELSRLPLLGAAMQAGGFVSVERQNRERALAAIGRGAASLRAGNPFLIFPEGTRSHTHELLPFKKGGFIMAIDAQAPIVPVAVMGGRAAMRKGSLIVRPVTMSIRVGPPVETTGMTIDDRDRLIATVRDRIEMLLAQGPVTTEYESTRSV